MKSNLKCVSTVLAAAGILCVSVPSANAVLTLSLDDPGTIGVDVVVADGDADGVVSFNGSFGVWSITITSGLSKPAVGSDSAPIMDLNSISVSSGAGTLLFTLTDSFSTAPASAIQSTIGGALSIGSLQASVSTNPGGATGASHNFVLPAGGAFAGVSPGAAPAAPYDLILSAALVHNGVGTSQIGWEVATLVPEPNTLSLLGCGATLLLSRRLKRNTARRAV